MIVYRTMSSEELLFLIYERKNTYDSTIMGENTFRYEKGVHYIHFFKYCNNAFYYMKKRGNPVVAKLEIPDDLLSNIEYGFYGDVITYYDQSLNSYYMPLPEYVMKKDLFEKEFIIDLSSDTLWRESRGKDNEKVKPFINTKIIKKQKISQYWHEHEIYYEYVKVLAKEFNYNMEQIAKYLKTIELDDEIIKLAEKINTENYILIPKELEQTQKKRKRLLF